MTISLDELRTLRNTPGGQALLKSIRYAEGTTAADGYNIMFGGQRFAGNQHPDSVQRTSGYASAAAGAYQFMPGTWKAVAAKYGFKDFSPENQDLGALAKAVERGVDPRRLAASAGPSPEDIYKLAPEWASFPSGPGKGSAYGQPSKPLEKILEAGGNGNVQLATAQSPAQPEQRMAGNALFAAFQMPQASGLGATATPTALSGPNAPGAAGAMMAYAATQGLGQNPDATLFGLPGAFNPAAAAAPQAAPATAMATQSTGSPAPAQAAQGGSPRWEKPSSVVYENKSGQPGVDLFFESKQFPAVLGGRVKEVRREPGYGNFVVVESPHPGGGAPVDTLYSHLADGGVAVKPGDMVAPGQVIGRQGGTGNVRSADGTIASIDFLAAAPAGSGSMTPHSDYDRLRRFAVRRMGAA